MTDFWIGSTEYRRWWDAEPARIAGPVAFDGALGLELTLVELERTGERLLPSSTGRARRGTAAGLTGQVSSGPPARPA
jgi:hypothetical protein